MYPWYKRYGYLYGVPGSSEGAGPANNVNEEYSAFDRVFLEGLNSHVDVFDAQMYTRVPALRAWYENHVAILRQLGRYDISGPQVLLYRSDKAMAVMSPNRPLPLVGWSRTGARYRASWNWDIGRGALADAGTKLAVCQRQRHPRPQTERLQDSGGLRQPLSRPRRP